MLPVSLSMAMLIRTINFASEINQHKKEIAE